MRKLLFLMIVALLLLTISPATLAAESAASFRIGESSYQVNGETRAMDVAPYILDGRTMVPIRYIGYALGLQDNGIKWDQATRTVTLVKDNITEKFTVGSQVREINGVKGQMDIAPVLENGRVFLPARFVTEGFGFNVRWNGEDRFVYLTSARLNEKPQVVQKLENLFGVSIIRHEQGTRDWYWNPAPEVLKTNLNKSILGIQVDNKNYAFIVGVYWPIQPDISGVSYDLTPIQRALDFFFPGDPANKKIMQYCDEASRICIKSNGFERLPIKRFETRGNHYILVTTGEDRLAAIYCIPKS